MFSFIIDCSVFVASSVYLYNQRELLKKAGKRVAGFFS